MLEETRDTITVPASFMLRVLASINNIQSGINHLCTSIYCNQEFTNFTSVVITLLMLSIFNVSDHLH